MMRHVGGSFPILLVAVLLLLPISQAFLPPMHFSLSSPMSTRRHRRSFSLLTMQSLRDQFFAAVDHNLKTKFSPEQGDLSRVRAFVESCKAGSIPPTAPTDLPYFQPSEEYVPGLTAKPWHDPHSFEWVQALEDASPIIQDELRGVLGAGRDPRDFKGDSNVMTVMGAGWTALRMQRLGLWNDHVCARFPRTLSLLASLSIPFAVRGVMFARQAPGTGVQPHSDGRNFILTLHLGLQVPKEEGLCWMRVAEERRGWEEGKAVVIDTTFEHETGNASEEERYVLIIDFWHPELTPVERAALREFYDLRNTFEGRTGGGGVGEGRPPPMEKRREKNGGWLAGLFGG
ncbi:hypothetical protein VYU27_007538 [Nannochloropsis oceanica]